MCVSLIIRTFLQPKRRKDIYIYSIYRADIRGKEERVHKNGRADIPASLLIKIPPLPPSFSVRTLRSMNYRQVEFLAPEFFNRPR